MSKSFPVGPGIYDDMTPEVYHADPAEAPSLSSGIANILLTDSPLHAWHAHPRLNPEFEPEESKAMDLGSAAHCSFLYGNTDDVAWVDANDWRTKAAQEKRDEARVNGQIPMLSRQQPELEAMLEQIEKAIAESEWASTLGGKRIVEQSFFWKDIGGVLCRARLDLRVDLRVSAVTFDYKTQGTGNPGAFIAGNLCRMGYDTQAGFYRRALKKTLNIEDSTFVWIVQENKAPFDVSFVSMAPALKQMADDKADQAIKIWGECIRTGKWRGYTKRTCWAEPPAWALYQWAETPLGGTS